MKSSKNPNIVQQIKSNQPGAFELLVDEYQEKVLNTCYRFVNNRQDAEDIAQEVFIEVYRSIARFKDNSKISTWIYRIAVSKSLDAIRRKKRKKRFAQIQHVFGQEPHHEANQVSDPIDPAKIVEDEERARLLHRMIGTLSENQQIAITLNKFEGLNQREVAEIMGISVSAVDALVNRAKKNLYKRLYNYYKMNI